MISVICPCYNEQQVIPLLYKRLNQAAEKWGLPYEVIVIDDGSYDDTWKRLLEIHKRDNHWKLLRFSRNFGHQTALAAGMHYATGDCVIIIDSDLQDPPEEINRLIDKWKEGYEVVYAIRKNRKENMIKKFAYSAFYRILSKAADINIPLDSGDFCLMDKKVVDILKSMPEQNKFIRGLRCWTGFKQIGIEYNRDARAAGRPQYTLKKLIQLAIDGIFSFSIIPLRVSTYLGFIISFISLLFSIFTFIQRIFSDFFSIFGLKPVPGFATTVIAIFFMGGVQLLSLGIIGEYIGRIYSEVKRRPLWVIAETYGIEKYE